MGHVFLSILLSIALMVLGVFPAHSEDFAKTLSPYFYVEGGDEGVECFPLKSTKVNTAINGVIADVTVTQEYANTGTQPINARYIFPASTRAAVHGMTLTVGEDVIRAQIKERKEAKRVFQKAKAEGKSASLLAQHRPNVFSVDVANIMPGEEVKIELHYSELLVPEEGTYQFVYPTVVGPRYSTIPESGAADHHQWLKNPYLTSDKKPTSEFSMNIVLDAGMPIDKVSCTSHQTDADWNGENRVRLKLAQGETHGGNRDFILDYRLAGDRILTGLMLYSGENENFFTLMVQPPKRITPEAIPPREYIFVVDVSGSMRGFPLDTSKALLRSLASGLKPQDTFNVILFSGSAHVLSEKSLPASSDNLQRAMTLVESQRGGGGTELGRALRKALDLPRSENTSRTIVIVTDGYIAAERDVFGLIENNINSSNLFAFGIGRSVNRYLIEGMAKAGQGETFIVTEAQEATAVAGRFKSYIEAPVLTGIGIDFDGFEVSDVEPKRHADLFAQRPLVISGKWTGDPKGAVRIRGTTGTGTYYESFDVSTQALSDTNRALPYLWARKRLARLIDHSSRPNEESTKAQVTDLGLKYCLLTRYTSFVAVHEVVRNTSMSARDVIQPLPLPKGVSNCAIGRQAIGTRNAPEPEIMAVLFMLCVVGFALYRRRKRHSSPNRGSDIAINNS